MTEKMKRVYFCHVCLVFISMVQLRAQQITQSGFVFDTVAFPSCHASTISDTEGGLVVAWFGGTHEKHEDVGIWVSRQEGKTWTAPIEVANGVQHEDKRYPCWNPVLFDHPTLGLMLFFKVGPNPREWWGELMISQDNGQTWSLPRRLPEGIDGPVKNKPELLPDGTLLCPSSTEYEGWRVHMEMTRDGISWKRIGPLLQMDTAYQVIQPSILIHDNGELQILCRTKNNRVATARSVDHGETWTAIELTELPNPNSGTDAVTASNGNHYLVYNPTINTPGRWGGPRTPLVLAVSSDGVTWQDVLTLEDEPGEYSYPAIVTDRQGNLQITYTWRREKIKHVTVKIMH